MGVRIGDTMSPKISLSGQKTSSSRSKATRIDGRYLNPLLFAEDILLISQDIGEFAGSKGKAQNNIEKKGLTMT